MFSLAIRPDAELRILEERYAEKIYEVVDANRESLREWLAWVDHTNGPEDVLSFIRKGLQQFARNDGFQAGIWWQGRYCGGVGIVRINWVDMRSEIGYWLAVQARGQGLVTDGCRAMLRYLFADLGLNRVDIRVAAGNEPSSAVARRLGAVLEGVERQGALLNGRFVDMQRFAVLREDWEVEKRHET